MGRMMPLDCEKHHQVISWGDFGPCQGFCDDVHPEDLDNCPDEPGCPQCRKERHPSPKWSRDDVQRVLYTVVDRYLDAAILGGDDELLRSTIFGVAIPTLQDNNHWPEDRDLKAEIESYAERRAKARKAAEDPQHLPLHTHMTRDIKPRGECPACDRYNHPQPKKKRWFAPWRTG